MDLAREREADYHFGMNSLREAREAAGLTQARLAELARTSQPQIKRLEAGDRKLTREWAERLAPHLKLSPQKLMFGELPDVDGDLIDLSAELVPVHVSGVTEAGAFREANEFVESERVTIYEPRDREFPHARQGAFDVAGDSMDALIVNGRPRPILPGDRVVTIDFEDLEGRLPLQDGMVVVVEQVRDGGHLREWSVKQLEIHDDRFEFHPRSTNLKHKPIVVKRDLNADDGRSVRILALVRGIRSEIGL